MSQMNAQTNVLAGAAWCGDFLDEDALIPGGGRLDPTQFLAADAVLVTAGAAAAGAIALPVTALPGALPSATVLDFGTGKFAYLTSPAAAGATSLAVRALPTALTGGETAQYAGVGRRNVQSGTIIGRTFAQRAANAAFHIAADTDDEMFIIAFDVTDVVLNPDVELYRPSQVVKENFLPNFATLSATVLAKIRSLYVTTRGVN